MLVMQTISDCDGIHREGYRADAGASPMMNPLARDPLEKLLSVPLKSVVSGVGTALGRKSHPHLGTRVFICHQWTLAPTGARRAAA
jgi:hypothetical protein